MQYLKGKHIIATLHSTLKNEVENYASIKFLFDNIINEFKLENLGDVYHNFNPLGFTAVVCLSESHISIHTWPENNLINLDIYLSNFKRNNSDSVDIIFEKIVNHFDAAIIDKQIILR